MITSKITPIRVLLSLIIMTVLTVIAYYFVNIAGVLTKDAIGVLSLTIVGIGILPLYSRKKKD